MEVLEKGLKNIKIQCILKIRSVHTNLSKGALLEWILTAHVKSTEKPRRGCVLPRKYVRPHFVTASCLPSAVPHPFRFQTFTFSSAVVH